MSKIIQVTQKPIIEYSIIQQISQEVDLKIQSLNIDTLEASEDNLSGVKSVRAELSKDFKVLEEQRKMVKDVVLKDYNLFEEQYKTLIANKFKNADLQLKSLVDAVSDEILNLKIVGLKEYFMDNNIYEWLKFEDLGLKIIKSISDKKLKDEIDEYLAHIKSSIDTIRTMPNSERIYAKFQMSKNLNDAISQTNIEIQREESIKKQQEERERLEAERKAQYEAQQSDVQKQAVFEHSETVVDIVEVEVEREEPKVYKSNFTVYGTKEQFSKLKYFMNSEGIRYE